jgi:hypothetical protein
MFTQCKIYCGPWYGQSTSELTKCYWDCNYKYQSCLENGTWP